MIKDIKVVTYSRDGQDGGGNVWLYNSEEELQKDMDFTDEQMQEIRDEDDPYENGEIGTDTISIEIDDSGNVRLADSVSIHWGQ